jgi:enoyl-CoA hydratase/carnithine racemase
MPSNNEPALLLREDRPDGVTVLTLNRPAQFNALSVEMLSALQSALDDISTNAAIRVVVIAGAGKAFCAGHDLKQMRAQHTRSAMQKLFRQCARVMTTIGAMPQPVIARVHGIATAAGCQLVASCDLAVAANSARFAVSGINVGLFCGTPAVALSRAMGRKQAMEMLLTGEFIDAAEAQHRGLINRVVPEDQLDAEVGRLAASICAKSAVAVAAGKQLFYRQLDMGVDAAYQLAVESMVCNVMSEDAALGIDAFMARQKPEWTHR